MNPAQVDNFKNKCIDLSTYIPSNESECIRFFGDNIEQSLKRYPNKIIITLGDKGACFYDGKHIFIKGF